MIPILYKANATKFNTYGIGVLKDCTKCEVTEERNGAFECVLKYPVNGPLYSQIAVERLIKAKPNDTANDQMFRIYRISTPINGEITIYAQHLSYDLSNIAALPWDMKVSYKKLWKLLIDLDMKKKDLCALAGISPASVTKMGKGGHVTTEILSRICTALNCQVKDIMEIIPDGPSPQS